MLFYRITEKKKRTTAGFAKEKYPVSQNKLQKG